MNIQTDQYQIAPLQASHKAIEVIQEAENAIAEVTGKKVTLIAYQEKDKGNSLS
jgi:hypothetical protein